MHHALSKTQTGPWFSSSPRLIVHFNRPPSTVADGHSGANRAFFARAWLGSGPLQARGSTENQIRVNREGFRRVSCTNWASNASRPEETVAALYFTTLKGETKQGKEVEQSQGITNYSQYSVDHNVHHTCIGKQRWCQMRWYRHKNKDNILLFSDHIRLKLISCS